MKKPLLALALTPFLVACGGGDKAPARGGSMTSANAIATRTGPCPILNGNYVRAETDEREAAALHVRTAAIGNSYSYSFLDPKLSPPRFDLADNLPRAVAGDPGNSTYRLTCDATSITSVSTKSGAPTIVIRYMRIDDKQLAIDSTGAEYMDGIYLKE